MKKIEIEGELTHLSVLCPHEEISRFGALFSLEGGDSDYETTLNIKSFDSPQIDTGMKAGKVKITIESVEDEISEQAS